MKARRSSRSDYTFSQVPTANIPRSSIRRSGGHTTSGNEGTLYPVFIDEVLPGDTFKVKMSLFGRLSTPIAPLMDSMTADMHWFFVPNRLVWDNWERFCGQQDNPEDSTDFLIPQVEAQSQGFLELTPFDYAGIPPSVPNIKINALPFRCMTRIWNEWYRDQNLQSSRPLNTDDGPDSMFDYASDYMRNKRADYFCSSLPWPQKGPGVELPLGDSAPVVPVDNQQVPGLYTKDQSSNDISLTMETPFAAGGTNANLEAGWTSQGANLPGGNSVFWQSPTGLQADLSNATAATINSMRTAFQIQRLLERDARGGTRYTEILRSHFRVQSPDARLQRSELLAVGSVPLIVNPVPQTSETTVDNPQGSLAGYGTMAGGGLGFTKSFTEHGHIIGFLSVRAPMTYQQGINRMFTRRTRYDFYWPAFAFLGEQAVRNDEIYAQDPAVMEPDGTTPTNEATWGYQERWAEYRYRPSIVSAAMRSGYSQGSLDFWHLAYDFDTKPELNAAFIVEAPPVDRVVAVPSQPHFIFDMWFDAVCARPMPLYSVPGLIDHF